MASLLKAEIMLLDMVLTADGGWSFGSWMLSWAAGANFMAIGCGCVADGCGLVAVGCCFVAGGCGLVVVWVLTCSGVGASFRRVGGDSWPLDAGLRQAGAD